MTTANALEDLAKSAVDEAENGGKPLTTVLVSTLQSRDLNSEQIRRVVEFANVEAFNRGFASTSGDYRMVDIPHGPADPAQVLQDLYAGREEAAVQDTSDYDYAPSASDLGEDAAVFDEDMVDESAGEDLAPLAAKLAAASEQLLLSHESERVKLSLALGELEQRTKRALREGADPSALLAEWQGIDPSAAKVAAPLLVGYIETQGHVKVSSKKINPAHPVCTVFSKVAKHAKAADEYYAASLVAAEEAKKVANLAYSAGRGTVGAAKAIGRGIRGIANAGANFGEGVVRGAGVNSAARGVGSDLGRLVGGGVALSGTALAGAKGVQHVSDSVREANERRRQEKEYIRMQKLQARAMR